MTPKAAPSFYSEVWATKDAEAHDIGDGLLVGSQAAAGDAEALRRWRVSHVLVVHPTLPERWPGQFAYRRVPLDDSPTANLLEQLPDALEFLEAVQRQRGRVLMHCTRGISRSASIAIAFLMLFKGMSYAEAMMVVERRRPVVYPNMGFRVQLMHLEGLFARRPIVYPNMGFRVQLMHLEVLVARTSGEFWEERIDALRAAVPQGDLTVPGATFRVREAMVEPVQQGFDEVAALAERALSDPMVLQHRALWRPHGLFFETLQKYRAVPADPGLVGVASSVARRLGNLPRIFSDKLPGVQAAVAVAAEVEAWIQVAGPALEAESKGRAVVGVTCGLPPAEQRMTNGTATKRGHRARGGPAVSPGRGSGGSGGSAPPSLAPPGVELASPPLPPPPLGRVLSLANYDSDASGGGASGSDGEPRAPPTAAPAPPAPAPRGKRRRAR